MKDFLRKSNKNMVMRKQARRKRGESEIVSWLSALKRFGQAVLQVDRSKITAFQAVRSTIGVLLPLAIGVLTGHTVVGVSMAAGSMMAGAVGLTYTYKMRTRIMLLDCLCIALSAFVGGMTSSIAVLSVVLIGIWGFGAGMAVSISQPAMIVGLQSCIAFIILSHFMLPPTQAAGQAALILGGALLQTILGIFSLPWKTSALERSALSAVYQQLADYTASTTDEQNGQQVREALLQAHSTLSQSDKGRIFSGLLDEVEKIRLSLTILAHLRQKLMEGTTEPENEQKNLDQIIQSTSDELRAIANELKPTPKLASSPRPNISKPYEEMKQALAALRQQECVPGDEKTIQQIVAYADTLRDQLHAAKKLAKSLKHIHTHQRLPVTIKSIPQQAHLQLHNTWITLRANLTLRSTTFRHAIRLGILLALTTTLYRLLNLPLERGYWVPLTAVLVLRSDFITTFTRGIARMVGTLLGALLTTLLLAFFAPSQGVLIVLIALVTFLAFSILLANYALFSAITTIEIVFLLSLIFPQTLMLATHRAIDTIVGGMMALLMYLLWPTWERSQVPENIAKRVETLRDYFDAVMQAYANPGAYNEAVLRQRGIEARLARSNAEGSVQRSSQEPDHSNMAVNQGLLEAADAIACDVFLLEAYLIDNPSSHTLPQITVFARTADEALNILANAIRTDQPVRALPDLQEALHALQVRKRDKYVYDTDQANRRFIVSEAKGIISNIQVMQHLLSGQGSETSTP